MQSVSGRIQLALTIEAVRGVAAKNASSAASASTLALRPNVAGKPELSPRYR
jgi:hypothetical protein